jgi:hypothetical protein
MPSVREHWVRTFVQAHTYVQDPLRSLTSLKNAPSFVGANRSLDIGERKLDRQRSRR